MRSLKLASVALAGFTTFVSAAKPPAILAKFFEANKEVRGEIVKVDMPGEFLKYRKLLSQAQAKDPEWFKKHQEKAGEESLILPYDPKLGISKADHEKYKAIYNKRKFKRVEGGEVNLVLTEEDEGVWGINVFTKNGAPTPFSALSFIAKDDVFKSMNGSLVRIEDIKSPKESVYGAWNGYEYRFFDDGNLVKTKENIAIGRTGDGKYGLLFHSLQELTGRGQLLADNLLIIRFVPTKLKK